MNVSTVFWSNDRVTIQLHQLVLYGLMVGE